MAIGWSRTRRPETMSVMEFVVVTGQSGAGRSQAANYLEDLGWFVIDNLPPALIPKVSELALSPGSHFEKVALVAGAGLDADGIAGAVQELRTDPDSRVRVLFLQARTPVLVRRYESSRRPHPWHDATSLAGAIEAERDALEVVKAEADMLIDTSDLNVHDLRTRVVDAFSDESGSSMQARIMSFGFKHGLPLDVDMVLDCRFLPNPHWVDELRPQTGLDEGVAEYLKEQPITGQFLTQVSKMLTMLVPAYVKEGKSYLTIALGCTGGHHRSVWIAEQIAAHLTELGYDPHVTHRDINR